MDLIANLRAFVRVAETGSFSAVAREANASQSAVTRQIAHLEDRFDVRLFHRTTRKLSLTDEGHHLLERARHLLEQADELQEAFGDNAASPAGHVRIGLPIGASLLLAPDFAELLAGHPGLSIEIVVSERPHDLVAEGLDLAMRIGASQDASLVARAVASLGFAPVAAPAYLERAGAPSRPSDLLDHTCIVYDGWSDSGHWRFLAAEGGGPGAPPAGTAVDVDVRSAFRSNNAMVARQAALAAYGIALLGEPMAADDIRTGRLVRLLPGWTIGRRQAYVVYPSRRHLPARTRLVIDFLVDRFRNMEDRLKREPERSAAGLAWLT